MAHLLMLHRQGLIGEEHARAIMEVLVGLHDDGLPEEIFDDRFEDVHAGIEAYLIDRLGEETGGRIHAGRSRNDEVATCIRIRAREEHLRLMGSRAEVVLGPQKILLAGLQGSGKTTTTAKLARYFQRKGLKAGVICADTLRPGAYDQLSTLCGRVNVPCYGEPGAKAAEGIVERGLAVLASSEVILIDTQGRHALEKDQVGVPLPFGVTQILRESVPANRETEVALLGRNFQDEAAVAAGLAHEVVEPDAFEAAWRGRAEEFLSRDLEAMRITKRYLRARTIETIRGSARQLEAEFVLRWFSEPTRRRVGAIVEDLGKRGKA